MVWDAAKHDMMIQMSNDLLRQEDVLKMANYMLPHRALGHNKVRLGSRYDGGYVMLDDFSNTKLALSFGIEANASWDLEIVNRGIPVWQYDHSIPTAPIDHDMLRFHKTKVAAQDSTIDSEECATIASILTKAQISKPCEAILKIDIEGDEWDVFDACTVEHLSCFSQILVEFHAFSRGKEKPWLAKAMRVLEKINQRFAVYHVHANNWSEMAVVSNVYIPETLEVSFGNRARYRFEVSNEIFPTSLDQPNNPLLPDLYLGTFSYKPIG